MHLPWLQKVGSNGATLRPKSKGLTPNQNIRLSNLCNSKLTLWKYELWSCNFKNHSELGS